MQYSTWSAIFAGHRLTVLGPFCNNIKWLILCQPSTESLSLILTFSMELMVTPAAQDTMRCRSSMSGPISSKTNGIIWGLTARKRTSLLFTVSLLLVVKYAPIFWSTQKYIFHIVIWWCNTTVIYVMNSLWVRWQWADLCLESSLLSCEWLLHLKDRKVSSLSSSSSSS